MKNVFFLLILALSCGLSAKEFVITCNSCSSYQMKQKAESIYIQPYAISYANIFDEESKTYKRYKLTSGYIDDMILVTMATEDSILPDVQSAFYEYIDAMKDASSSLSTISTLEIDSDGGISSQSHRNTRNFTTMNISSVHCQATPVSSGDLTAHDYVSSSQNRRVLFNKLKSAFDNETGGKVAIALLKYGSLITKLEGHSNKMVSMVGSTLGLLDVSQIKMNTADGGFIKGYMNFKSESFDIAVATDGDCNDIPTSAGNAESMYSTSTGGGADKMIDLLLSYGGRRNVPVCQKETKVCTGISGQTLSCYSICFQWR